MIKIVGLLKRKPGLSREEFSEHYYKVHGPLAVQCLSTMSKYVQNHVTAEPLVETDFDGITEVWFDNLEGCEAAIQFWKSEAGRVIRDDEDKFMDRSKLVTLMIEEKIMK